VILETIADIRAIDAHETFEYASNGQFSVYESGTQARMWHASLIMGSILTIS
jgi:hypothetical protein